jgi:UDP-GlcNAc:undecaprenyl-phosphate GlcNAc-1-phosphate transferase
VRFAFELDGQNQQLFLTSLPLVLIATYSAFFVIGVYRGAWHHTETADLKRLAQGAVSGALIAMLVLVVLYRFTGYSRTIFLLYALFLFLATAGARLSFRLFRFLLPHPPTTDTVPVLIYGAGSGGVLIANRCRKDTGLRFQAKGFVDDDPHKQGDVVSGLPVFGGVECLEQIIEQEHIQGLLISSSHILAARRAEKVRLVCRERGVWIEQLRVELVED